MYLCIGMYISTNTKNILIHWGFLQEWQAALPKGLEIFPHKLCMGKSFYSDFYQMQAAIILFNNS